MVSRKSRYKNDKPCQTSKRKKMSKLQKGKAVSCQFEDRISGFDPSTAVPVVHITESKDGGDGIFRGFIFLVCFSKFSFAVR